MTVTTEYGKENIFAKETQPIIMNNDKQFENAERLNGIAAMLGVIAALGAYATTGQIIPGVF
tara:strand:+ start:423 stop:608 length:186 start_codon:yes stop_codon:yes gene_type:complete